MSFLERESRHSARIVLSNGLFVSNFYQVRGVKFTREDNESVRILALYLFMVDDEFAKK